MSLDEHAPVDANSAGQETLCLLPGVGPALAARWIAARPFETLDDLTRVPGIGASTVERLRPYLALPAAAEPDSSDAASGDVQDVSADESAAGSGTEDRETKRLAAKVAADTTSDLPVLETQDEEPEPVGRAPEQKPLPSEALPTEKPATPQKAPPGEPPARRAPAATRRYAGCLVAASGLLVLVLSIALSLGILARLNQNQLRFASPAQANMLTVRVDGLEMRVESLAQDVEGLRARLNQVEIIGERMQAAEERAETLRGDVDAMGERLDASQESFQALQAEVDAAATRVAELSAQLDTAGDELSAISGHLDELSADVETVRTESGRFKAFLEGLQTLMETLFNSQGGE
jgi:archaellum component FlaC